MQKELTIALDEQIYEKLYQIIGPDHISQFIETLVRPYVFEPDLATGYQAMAEDEVREDEAVEWIEALVGDAFNRNSEVSKVAGLHETR